MQIDSHTATNVSNACAALTGSSGLLTFFNENASAFGLLITFLMGVTTAIFYWQSLKIKRSELADKQQERIKKDIVAAFREELSKSGHSTDNSGNKG